MRLTHVNIRNFRSLQDVTIQLEPRCRALIGINESGKSNILKALALLDSTREVQNDDIRDFSPDEGLDQPAFVRFVFSVDKDERIECLESISAKILSPDKSTPIIRKDGRGLTLAQFVDSRDEALYRVDLRTRKKHATIWGLSDSYEIADGWFEPVENAPPEAIITLKDGTTKPLNELSAIHRSFLKEDLSHVSQLSLTTLDSLVREELTTLVEESKPECLYWTYSDSQLLPGQIVLDSFAAKPTTCEPLRQMFALAGYGNVQKAVAEAKNKANGIRNLLNRVAEKSTDHMRSVWKDYRGIKIELAPNGPHIDASIKDQYNLYNFDRRSDGFKRFISFLLLVSAKVKNDELENTLYLHDEPDIGLHPSGARYLRDELIKIAKKNYVVFSTHSIFMVDRERVGRHLIVTKNSEVTSVAEADGSNIADEEVLYNALGYSLFETLREVNLIFEGWRDKQLFRTALNGSSPRAKKLKRDLRDVGLCHAKGVKDIGRITPLLELASRQWLIVSDADKPAREQQRNYRGDGKWFRYDELLNGSTATTSEDFIKPDAFKPVLNEIQKRNPSLPKFDVSALSTSSHRIHTIRQWLEAGGVTDEPLRILLDQIKEGLCESLKPAQIEDKYLDFCEALVSKLNAKNAT
ncbi:MAG: AAA family ATPase [Pirellulales bacterium]